MKPVDVELIKRLDELSREVILKTIPCDDPQCGDSTWDHNCTARTEWEKTPAAQLAVDALAEIARLGEENKRLTELLGKGAEAMGCIRLLAHIYGLNGPQWSEEPGFGVVVNGATLKRATQFDRLSTAAQTLAAALEEAAGELIYEAGCILRGPNKLDGEDLRAALSKANEDKAAEWRALIAAYRGLSGQEENPQAAQKLARAVDQSLGPIRQIVGLANVNEPTRAMLMHVGTQLNQALKDFSDACPLKG